MCRHGTNGTGVRRATDAESITQRRFTLTLYNIASIVYRVSREEREARFLKGNGRVCWQSRSDSSPPRISSSHPPKILI